MFTQRVTFIPATGKGPDVQALVRERVMALKGQEVQASLTTQLFNPDGPALAMVLRFADLAALGEFRKRNAADPAYRAFVQKVSPLSSRPNRVELYEIILPAQRAMTPESYIQRATWTPAFGKGPELQQVLEEQMRARQAQGVRASL